jgi:putative transposase
VSFINKHRESFGVEPICDVLQVAPSTYYAAVSRPPSTRQMEDEKLTVELLRVFEENQQVYGAEKLWTQMNREGIAVGRDRVARLMRAEGLAGEVRGKVWRTTFPSQRQRRDQRIWSIASSKPRLPIGCGWPT